MNVYIFQAALLCESCGKATADQLRESIKSLHPEFEEENESTFDSDYFPKGPYPDGGGEADTPQHCDHCHAFLENPLTADGVTYVQDALDNGTDGEGSKDVLAQWAEFYEMTPRYWFSTSSGWIELRLTLEDARSGSHQGRCDDDIEALRRVPYIKAQLDALDPVKLAADLSEYGAWEEAELADHDANLNRILWLACGDIRDSRKG
jgi:hypothetical protein